MSLIINRNSVRTQRGSRRSLVLLTCQPLVGLRGDFSSTLRILAGCTRSSGLLSDPLNNPISLSFDSHGNIYAVDALYARIQKFSLFTNSCSKSLDFVQLTSLISFDFDVRQELDGRSVTIFHKTDLFPLLSNDSTQSGFFRGEKLFDMERMNKSRLAALASLFFRVLWTETRWKGTMIRLLI